MEHDSYNVDYIYNFEMQRFATLDLFILSQTLSTSVVNINVDNMSDHDTLFLVLKHDVDNLFFTSTKFTTRPA